MTDHEVTVVPSVGERFIAKLVSTRLNERGQEEGLIRYKGIDGEIAQAWINSDQLRSGDWKP